MQSQFCHGSMEQSSMADSLSSPTVPRVPLLSFLNALFCKKSPLSDAMGCCGSCHHTVIQLLDVTVCWCTGLWAFPDPQQSGMANASGSVGLGPFFPFMKTPITVKAQENQDPTKNLNHLHINAISKCFFELVFMSEAQTNMQWSCYYYISRIADSSDISSLTQNYFGLDKTIRSQWWLPRAVLKTTLFIIKTKKIVFSCSTME